MARLGLLLLVGALAASASKFYDDSFVPTLTETVFRPGVEYTYKYDSQVLTGIPNGGNQFSGLKIKCLVRLHMKSPSHVVMKLDEIRLCEVNSDLRSSLPSEMIPEELCTSSTSEHFRVMITELSKPISFRYDNGLVSRLESDISDPFWSVNIKRAVLNLLHVSLRQERQVSDISPEDFAETTDFTLRNIINRDRSFDKIFKVKEHDVVGDCETLYAVYEKDPTVTSCNDCFHVTKVKDYKRCTDKVLYEQGLFAGHTSWLWLPNDERKMTITPVTHVTYEMSGTRNNFLINKAKLHSEYIFTPYSEEGGSMVTYIKCHLTLVNTDTPSVSIVVGPTPVVHTHALLLHVPHALAKLGKGTFSPESSYSEISSRRDSWDSPRRDSWDSTTYNKFERESTFDRESFASRDERESPYDVNREKPTWGRRDTEWESPEVMTRSSRFGGFPEEEGEESIFDESVFNKWESSYRKFDWSRDSIVSTPTSNIDKVRMMLKDIVSSMTPYITEETPTKIIYLKRVLETCTSDELWTIVNDICSIIDTSEPEHKKIKEIILDLLPVVPKPIVPHIIRSLVSKNVIYPKRGAYMISLYSLMAPASPRIVKSMLSACKHPVMLKTDTQLKRTCVLGLGTVTHKLFGMQLKTKVAKTVFFGVIEEVVRELKTLFLTSTSLETKVLVLKTIGNTGLPEFLPELHRIIKDKSHPVFIRKLAVYALRRMTILTPNEVNKICLPVFMDSRETSEMRISCFLMTMYTKPRTSTVMLMAHRLRNDPSTNLKSFVYSYLSSLAKTSLPAHHYAAKSAKLALQTMKPYDFGFSHSKGYHFDFNHEKLDFGAMLESFLIHTPTSSLPKGFVVKLGSVLAHRPYYLFETGVEVKGLDDIISNIYSRTRPVWTRLSSYDWSRFMTPEWYREISPEVSSWFSNTDKFDLRDWLKSFESSESTTSWDKADWGSVDSTMRDILSKIKFEDRSRDLPELFTYFKILSNQVTFFNLDKNIVSDIISSSEWLSTLVSSYRGMGQQIPINVIKTLPLIDNCYVIATPMGMPLHLNFTALAIAKVSGHVTPVSVPSLGDILSRSIVDEIKVAVDLKPSFAVKMLCEMGVHFNVMKATTVIKGHVIGHSPIKSNILLNWAEKKFKLDWEIPTESFTPLKVGMKVATRIFKLPLRHFHLITSTLNEEKDIVHPTVVKSVPINVSPIATVFGMRLGLTSELHSRRASWSPFYPLCGRFRFHVTCTPTEERPRLAEFKVIFGSSYPSEFYTSKSPSDRFESSTSEEYDVLSSLFPARKDYRTSIRDEIESDFDTVMPFSEISSPRSRHVTWIMRTVGGSRKRFAQTHLTWIHSLDYLKHQLNYQITGSSIFDWNTSPIKVMLDTFINLKTLFRPYTQSDSLVGKIDFFYGDRSDESDFSLKVLSGRTGMSWESEYSPLSRYTWASNLPGDKYEYYTTLKYNRLPTFVEDKLTQGLELLKIKLYPYLYIKNTGLTSDSNKITAYIKVVPKYKKLTAIINTPTERDVIVDVPTSHPMFEPETVSLAVPSPVLMTEGYTPSSVFSPEEFSTRTSPRWSWFKSFTGLCTVMENMVKTFDDVTYSMPEMPTACETILARDCSSMGLWMVTVTSVTPTMKMVRMLVPRFEFKLMPSSSFSDMTLYINGVPKTLTSRQSLTLPDTTISDDAIYTITKEGEMIKIECLRTGIVVMTNGKHVMIKSPSTYRARVCGMCGNFDGQRFNEYEGPMKTVYERPEHSVIKYTIPSAECSLSNLITKHNVPSDSVYSGECLHEMRNIAKATYLNGEKKICFTIKPEPVCSESCKRVNPRPKYASFHCLPANDVTTQTLMRERTQRVLTELAWKRVDLTDYIDTQDKCVSI